MPFMPSAFPESEFRAFSIAAGAFFPELLSDEVLFDRLERRRHFDWSCQAVRYRYRLCSECCVEFKALLADPSEAWQAGWGDEELNYKLERCIYVFFMSGLSVLESFVFCLYFLGNAIRLDFVPGDTLPLLRGVHRTFNRRFLLSSREVDMPTLRGSCLCHGVQFEITGPLISPSNCHCSMCRKQHGAAFRSRARVQISDFKWIQGEDLVTFYESSPGSYRAACAALH
jgi:Glutathione-dependent formaldehyde-activating enzyme